MLLLYGLLFAFALITALMISLNLPLDISNSKYLWFESRQYIMSRSFMVNLFSVLSVVIYAILIVVTVSAMFFYAINRFRVNLLSDEGYLMHTLPVSAGKHILAKCIVSSVWTIAGTIAAIVSLAIVVLIPSAGNITGELSELFSNVHFTPEDFSSFIRFIVLLIVGVAELYLCIYASMAIGYSFRRHRAAASIGAYVLLNIVETTINSFYESLRNILPGRLNMYLLLTIIFTVLWSVAMYFIARYFLERRLNLQ